MIHVVEAAARRLRLLFSRSEWSLRLLKLPRINQATTEHGLLLIQIDGFSRMQFERALRKGRMPFLRRLMRREGYQLHTVYSGIPSSTPAAQAELFYGVKCAVPSFGFRDKKTGKVVSMLGVDTAVAVQNDLAKKGRGLFENGCAYSNIFSGGAKEAHFCASTLGVSDILGNAKPLGILSVLVWNSFSVARLVAVMVMEIFLAFYDAVRGALRLGEIKKEFNFIISRVAVCVGLRELITIMASIDVTRGQPMVHVNYNGYDEQSHRRGPSSQFAHFALAGIDHSIKRLWKAAHRSAYRDYDIWIYSDHGQESAVPYEKENGRGIADAVLAVFNTHRREEGRAADPQTESGSGAASGAGNGAARGRKEVRFKTRKASRLQESQTAFGRDVENWMTRKREDMALRRMDPKGPVSAPERTPRKAAAARPGETPPPARAEDGALAVVTALGPLGHIYPRDDLSLEQKEVLARRLVREARIPIVLFAAEEGSAIAHTVQGRFRLPEDGAAVLGARHPFLDEAAKDLACVCHHENAGALVLSGWRLRGRPLTFAYENGAHGGPGSEETRAFTLLPGTAPLPQHGSYMRHSHLREAVQRIRGQKDALPALLYHRRRRVAESTVRIMTYNVHGCAGMDGKTSMARITRVIAHYQPDIICLQESLADPTRNPPYSQARIIAHELMSLYHFQGELPVVEDDFGNAVISLYPLRAVKRGELPGLPNRPLLERRGAVWVAVDVGGEELQIVNCHLGLYSQERVVQAQALLGPEWLGDPRCGTHAILTGDFNAFHWSTAYRLLAQKLGDAQTGSHGLKPKNTFFGRVPVGRIDHVFHSKGLRPLAVEVPRTHLTRLASDHLPVIAEFAVEKSGRAAPAAEGRPQTPSAAAGERPATVSSGDRA